MRICFTFVPPNNLTDGMIGVKKDWVLVGIVVVEEKVGEVW